MASEDLIDAKLKAFEPCMEDKLRALFAEFKVGRSPSLTKSQQGEGLDHKKRPPEKEEQATDPAQPRMRVDFPRFEILSNQARDWSEKQLLGTFIEGLKPEIREVKVRQPYTLTVAISFALIQEKRLNQDVRRTRTMPRPAAYKPSTPSASSRPSQLKKLIREELRDRSAKGLCWHCDEPWSRDHRCKRGRLLLIEPINDSEHEEEDLEHEEVTGEEP
ncbi:hypothetical protein GW17_00061747 [Ensete ventricosum]|nr:hypothetical protein GW17_00061747 [Ensete ventricosum]